MNKALGLQAVILSFLTLTSFGAETNVLSSLTKEGREARKNAAIKRFDLDKDGKLDGAERNLLKNDLKAKMDPVRKRVYAPKGEPRLPLVPDAPAPVIPQR